VIGEDPEGHFIVGTKATGADFDRHHETVVGYRSDKLLDNADWAAIEAYRMFYATIPPMEDMPILWGRIRSHEPVVLTGISRIPGCAMQKRAWIATYLGEDVPVITCRSPREVPLRPARRHPDRRLGEIPAPVGGERRRVDHAPIGRRDDQGAVGDGLRDPGRAAP